MYCVICGLLLREENQEGIVCQHCKQRQRAKRGRSEPLIRVKYCFECGKVYHPTDMSIKHFCCSWTEINTSIAGFFFNGVPFYSQSIQKTISEQ